MEQAQVVAMMAAIIYAGRQVDARSSLNTAVDDAIYLFGRVYRDMSEQQFQKKAAQ